MTSRGRSARWKINKETEAVSDTLDQMYLIDVFRAFHPKAAECTFFSSAHGTFSGTDNMMGHKKRLNKFKKTEILSSIFSDHNGMKLEISHKKKTENLIKTWRLNNMLLNNEWVNNEVKEEINMDVKYWEHSQ